MIRPLEEADKPIEHLPACGGKTGRCVRGCMASQRWAPIAAAHYPSDKPAFLTTSRRSHHYPEGRHALPPLWEMDDADHHEYLQTFNVAPQYAEHYTRYERDPAYNLDDWTTETGAANLHLELELFRKERARTAKILATNEEHRAKVVAIWIREAFPGVAHLDDVTDAHNGFLAGCYAGIVWGIALYMFGLTHDPLPEHVSGRILKGAPVRDTRAPFGSVFAVLTQRTHVLLGAGASGAFPTVDRRSRRRDWAADGEIKPRPSRNNTDMARGEEAINRSLSGEMAVVRAGLTSHEQWQAEVIMTRGMTREQRTMMLREGLYLSRGGRREDLVTAETQRMRAFHDMTYVYDLAAQRAALDAEPDPTKRGALIAAFAKKIQDRLDAIAQRAPIDRDAYADLLREATADMSDKDLLDDAKACAEALTAQVYRATTESDDLAAKRKPRQAPKGAAASSAVWEPLF